MPEIRLSGAERKKYWEDSIARLMEKYADEIQRNREKGVAERARNAAPLHAAKAEDVATSGDESGVAPQ